MNDYSDRLVELLGVADDVVDCGWEPTEAEIGRPVPADYKRLISHTGSAALDDHLTVFAPHTSDEVDLAALVRERDAAWEHLRAGGATDLPERFFTEGRRLIAFAGVNAAYLYWNARDGVRPEDWGVVIVDADLDNWYELEMSATECLYRVLTGEIEFAPFMGLFGRRGHSAGRFGH
ncbi:hypothetical protein Cs7R123_47580 [Catellatospora sp. TT07R-123]|uniref:SMI1/KNR4 family protein n=1 Tax=Catellatospora sp. TT07R-123 TaxID=2733863 RepID=UPI001B0386D4|nr:SMI1/KNR4 family protein [Catellatospora sp. TT07R-123]GHJ47416.1 hypothetical protein Cs7R123_47580 [Catellatospora sp. TT07R-123]